MIELVLAVAAVLLSSALCSGTEAALFSVPLLKVRQMAQSKRPAAVALLQIRNNMSRPIASIVILNNIANIVGSIALGFIAARVLGDAWMGIFSGALTFFVIIFSEIIPKTVGERHSKAIALAVSRPILGLTWILTPVLWVVEQITAPFAKGENKLTTNESEIKLMAKLGQTSGTIEKDESEMILRVFELNDQTASDLMSPRTTLTYLNGSQTLKESHAHVVDSPHSRILVIGDDLDDVKGFVLKSEVLVAMIAGDWDKLVDNYLHGCIRVDEDEKADSLLLTFQKKRQHLAVVIDEFAGVSGVVTLEDVMEVLTGEIVDETDRATDLRQIAREKRRRLIEGRKP